LTRGFGRIAEPDPRDSRYPMRLMLRPAPVPSYRYYRTGKHLPLDQGQTGTCVAHAWTGFLYAALMMDKTADSPFDLYRGIVAMDEFPDNDFEATEANDNLQFGTSVRAGAQYLRTKGHLKNFVWSTSADEMALWLLTGKGTIVLGTNWYWDMGELKNGYAVPGGGIAGGHAYLCVGYSKKAQAFRCLNSWGAEFGDKGLFWIHHVDMEQLIHEDGEACAAVEQTVTPLPL